MKAQEGGQGDTCVCQVSLSQRRWWGARARVEAPSMPHAFCGAPAQTVHLEVLEKSVKASVMESPSPGRR